MRAAAIKSAPGTITAIEADGYRVAVTRHSACARCLRGEGCGMALLQLRRYTMTELSARGAPESWSVGDAVMVQLQGGSVFMLALLGFGVPLIGLLVGSAVGAVVGGDGVAALGSVVGTLVAAGIARGLFSRRSVGYVLAPPGKSYR